MFKYGKKSLDKLNTCHPDIQKIFNEAIKYYDITILEGVRTKERQEELVRMGMSKTLNSKHLKQEDGYSHAIDAALYPVDWNDRDRFVFLQGFVKGIADILYDKCEITHKLRNGIDWDGDGDIKDSNFFDGPHVELYKP